MARGLRQSIRGTKKKPRRKRADVTRIGPQAGAARRTSFAGLSAGKPSYAACLTKFRDNALRLRSARGLQESPAVTGAVDASYAPGDQGGWHKAKYTRFSRAP
jgi:hypothetical protein